MAVLSLTLFLLAPITRASEGFALESSTAVQAQFSDGKTDIEKLQKGAVFFSNKSQRLDYVPDELVGLQFTRRAVWARGTLTLHVPANTPAYLITGEGGAAARSRVMIEADKTWHPFGWAVFNPLDDKFGGPIIIYKHDPGDPETLTITVSGGPGVILAAPQIQLTAVAPVPGPSPDEPSDGSQVQPPNVEPAQQLSWQSNPDNPATRITKFQSSIKAMYVVARPDGSFLGDAADFIVTVDPGDPDNNQVPVSFATPVGPQMSMVLGDVMRRLDVLYPNIAGARAIQFSFEDKYDAHDGGSIGAACATLLLSVIRGFDIDPNLAITGDVSADGKIRAIGGIAAKLRGVKQDHCTIAAVPSGNCDQLIDAFVYCGPSIITDVQVLGISDLDEAVAVTRSDRDPKLAKAIELFSEIQKSINDSPGYLETPEAEAKLKDILDLAPNHLSARILLDHLHGDQRRRLTATASEFYMFSAVAQMLPTIYASEGQQTTSLENVSTVAIESGIRSLRHLRPMADLSIQPLIDTWIDFSSTLEQEGGWTPDVAAKAQAIRDALAKVNADQDLAQKMLKEGI
jgi:hypothetical protein